MNPTSQQAPVGTNAAQTGTTPGKGALASGQPGVNQDQAFEQAPLGTEESTPAGLSTTGDVRGANTTEEAMGSQLNNKGPIVDDSFDTQVRGTKDKIVGGFKSLLSFGHHGTNTTGTGTGTGATTNQGLTEQDIHQGLNPSRSRGGVNSGADDSFETQVRNTGAQVVGTFKGLGSALKMAGEKVQGSTNSAKAANATSTPTNTPTNTPIHTPTTTPGLNTNVAPNTATAPGSTGVPSTTTSSNRI